VTRIARLVSLAFVCHERFMVRRPRLPVEPLGPGTLDETVAFLQQAGPSRHLFPVVASHELLDGRAWRNLRLEDLVLVRRDGAVAGVLGTWDQSGYKQDVVAGYAPRLRRLRPGYDLLARALGGRPLPRPGERIRTAFGCLRCVADDDPDVLAALLAAARQRALQQGQDFLMLGFDERDPQLRQVPRWLHVTYRSEVFLGSFGGRDVGGATGGRDPAPQIDHRPVYVEVATL
jgi:hypothetical protein